MYCAQKVDLPRDSFCIYREETDLSLFVITGG